MYERLKLMKFLLLFFSEVVEQKPEAPREPKQETYVLFWLVRNCL